MHTVTLSDVRNRHGEVFDRAIVEPVFVTKQRRRSHVIMAAELYEAQCSLFAVIGEQLAKMRQQVREAASSNRVDQFEVIAEQLARMRDQILGDAAETSRESSSKYARQMSLARQGMARYRNTLHALAKQ